jgi:hypothetical protein
MNTLTYPGEKIAALHNEKIRQFLEESDSWKRLLDFLFDENSYLKIRLSHLDHLRIMENDPVKKENLRLDIEKADQVIALNKSAIITYEKWLNRQWARTDDELERIYRRHVEVRKQIEKMEISFAMQKVTFNDEVTKNL